MKNLKNAFGSDFYSRNNFIFLEKPGDRIEVAEVPKKFIDISEKAEAQLNEFGITVDQRGRRLLLPEYIPAKLNFDENTKNVSGYVHRGVVTLEIENMDGSFDTLVITSNSIRYNGQELPLAGKTFAEWQESGVEKIPQEISDLLEKYGPKGWVSRESWMAPNWITVSEDIKGLDPKFEYRNGQFHALEPYDEAYVPMGKRAFENYVKTVKHRE